MFTGIITSIGTVESADMQSDLRVKITSDLKADDMKIGDSIACNGCCLTVIAKGQGYFEASLSAETIRCTAPGQWKKGRKVNLEKSLRMGDSLDGHIVSGHVDGLVKVIDITNSGGSHILSLEAPKDLAKFIAAKGSVTLDGVSLTVNIVEGSRFSVNIIPHTWRATTLGERKAGDMVNVEIDLIARYVARLLNP